MLGSSHVLRAFGTLKAMIVMLKPTASPIKIAVQQRVHLVLPTGQISRNVLIHDSARGAKRAA
jgi:hypothetical protein